MSTVDDIMTVIMELDGKGVSTSFVAKNLNRLPKCDPKDIDPYANHQLIMALQERVHRLEDNMSEAKAEIICNQDALRSVKSSQDEMETVITNLVAEPPSYAGVTSINLRCGRNKFPQRELGRRHDKQSENYDEPGRDNEAVVQPQQASADLNSGMVEENAAAVNGDAEPRGSGDDDGRELNVHLRERRLVSVRKRWMMCDAVLRQCVVTVLAMQGRCQEMAAPLEAVGCSYIVTTLQKGVALIRMVILGYKWDVMASLSNQTHPLDSLGEGLGIVVQVTTPGRAAAGGACREVRQVICLRARHPQGGTSFSRE